MKDFKLDASGDVVITRGEIAFVEGAELMRQSAQQVIGTNKGEWRFDEEEGIDFDAVLGKNPDEDVVRDEIAGALQRIDETFIIRDFSMTKAGRNLRVNFTAVNDSGNEVGGEYEYGA